MASYTNQLAWFKTVGLYLLTVAPPVAHAKKAKSIDFSSTGQCLHGTHGLNPLVRQIHDTCPFTLVDDKWSSGQPSPWTHPIRCLTSRNETTREQRTSCLYTDALFAGSHGTSVITTPEVASDFISNDALEDRPYYGGSRKRGFVAGPVVRGGVPAYKIAATPGKGLGAVASRKIGQGEILMLDFPALLVNKKFLEVTAPKARRRLLKRGIAQLPAATQEKVFGLAKSTGGEEIDDILGTNTCSLTLGEEVHLGLYPEVSRLNHACNPNSYYRFSSRSLSMEVVAYRDIQPGEEITISYTQLTLSRNARREYLFDNWHFHCKCSLCRASTDEVTHSEDRRKDIRKLQMQLVDSSRNADYTNALTAADQLREVTDAEGVTPIMPEMHDIKAAIYLDMGDFTNARRLGNLALKAWQEFDSIDEYQLEGARWFLKHVEYVKSMS